MTALISRAGRFAQQPAGYRAFIPASLPPDPPLAFDPGLQRLLSLADQTLGRLDGVAELLPNPDLFVAMYVRREAVLSSQIEGTQSTLEDVLAFELDPEKKGHPHDVEEVVSYVAAMNHGLERLTDLPLSLRLIREIHGVLLQRGRGAERHPGEFRTSQNWIGAGNVPLNRATFVPPPVKEMHAALDNLEKFLHADEDLPDLVRCALAHAQFETIHPFLDGNGRMGRLLITFLLVNRGVLRQPLLYLSHYLKRHRTEYYDRLMAVRTSGDWEGWIAFFLRGVRDTAEEAVVTARAIIGLREQHRSVLQERGLGDNGQRLVDLILERPLLTVGVAQKGLSVSYNTARRLLGELEEAGLLRETTGAQRNRVFRYDPYLALFDEQEELIFPAEPVQETESEAATKAT